ncbi:MAG: acyl-CoA dehydrogenase family protein [Armatimonadota bacterium]|nr:acyl-CoA dehydrogenase family protein [Armatimonadota bacterium]MDR7422707.1 acyl-CoA dehydrogenase family protein [Armatimonadota bacterium]MDR7454269.1 acyl-CoA dehydrogenase family protein [Armatimonadota bacterium]MDR7456781.1 acyl-CoA dehydrogenase family protein [Armatimonadota bacterium]MDR7497347.1 acyl-CoA dehydrogenase family protein [Armatimonadota bacterium]
MNFALTPAQREVQERARRFAIEEVAPIARAMDERGEFPRHLVPRMGALGLLGGPLAPEYGGSGMDYQSFALVYEELGRVDASVRGFLAVHAGLVALCIRDWGTEEQKRRYLPRLARGEWIGCYALTEPGAGSDAASLETTATPDGDGYVLRGEKIWITNGGVADLAIVFATRDPSARHRGICAFLVETPTPGLRREPMPGRELGHRAADHARLVFEDCRVPAAAMLGAPGQGFAVAMSALDHGRLGVAAGAVGVAAACLDACVAFARTRRQFGRRIGDFQMIQAHLADMAADVDAARLLVYRAAWMRDQGMPATRETSIAKLFATEVAARAAGDAVLIHGGRGYSNEYPVERHYRDIKGLQIYEGTSHIQRIIIARDLVGREG